MLTISGKWQSLRDDLRELYHHCNESFELALILVNATTYSEQIGGSWEGEQKITKILGTPIHMSFVAWIDHPLKKSDDAICTDISLVRKQAINIIRKHFSVAKEDIFGKATIISFNTDEERTIIDFLRSKRARVLAIDTWRL
jgi:hypothetical protein